MDMRIPPLRIKSVLEPNPLKSIMLVRRLAVVGEGRGNNRNKHEHSVHIAWPADIPGADNHSDNNNNNTNNDNNNITNNSGNTNDYSESP